MTDPTTRRRYLLVGLPLVATLLLPTAPALAGAGPANDDFADARLVASVPAVIGATTVGATVQPNEPESDCDDETTHSIWYRLVPAFTGYLRVIADSTTQDSDVTIFRGSSLGGLTEVACNDDISYFDGDGDEDSRLTVGVQAGQAIRIRIDQDDPGDTMLRLKRVTPPANDSILSATPLGAAPVSFVANTRIATTSLTEPRQGPCGDIAATRWYSFTPSTTGTYIVDTEGATLDSMVQVFLRTGSGDLRRVACNDDTQVEDETSFQARVTWRAIAGRTYLLQIGGWLGQSGAIPVSIAPIGRAANDNLVNAGLIGSIPFTITRNLVNATSQAGEPRDCAPAITSSIWYRWTPGAETTVVASAFGLDGPDAMVAVYDGSEQGVLSELQLVDCGTGDVAFTAQPGETYWLRLAYHTRGYNGLIELSVEESMTAGRGGRSGAGPGRIDKHHKDR